MSGIKVLLHITDDNKWQTLLGNVHNMIKSGENFKIEVLANGVSAVTLQKAVSDFKNLSEPFQNLSKKDVTFCVCNQSLKRFNIKEDSLLPFVKIVPFGIVEVVKRENEGYCYVKP
ncbi:DsrE family protein [Clostridium fallax]|uniref:Uncharacterized protein n=1 Tax=Clostridium fallax TaxID=1533 RepID=A0A1M4ZL49_9CLOT|nr:DsrE family protein [Clostridium fallax]SHF18532.1 hypothetical protein SAMN05443638_1552 [Clostridium fallax]SQB06012.1 Uncharacterized conserved protein [Clostridium fallax]